MDLWRHRAQLAPAPSAQHSWLEPGEEKRFTQYFLPYAAIGVFKKASRDAALALDVSEDHAQVGVRSTSARPYRIRLSAGKAQGDVLDTTVKIVPERPFTGSVPLAPGTAAEELTLSVVSTDGEVSLSYRQGEVVGKPVPEPARAPLPPSEVRTSEELYLIGLHLEQYRHATFRPEDYYREALRRDPGDARCNQALGLLFLRRGDPRAGEAHLRRAVERLTARNPNPSDGAPFLFLGLALEMQERESEAADAYHKAAWNGGTRAAAHAALSRLAMRRGDFRAALESTGSLLTRTRAIRRSGPSERWPCGSSGSRKKPLRSSEPCWMKTR